MVGVRPALKPRDAATLIMVRRDAAKPRVLMGKRSENHAFMPGVFYGPQAPPGSPPPRHGAAGRER